MLVAFFSLKFLLTYYFHLTGLLAFLAAALIVLSVDVVTARIHITEPGIPG
jgi:hypothetical protein